MRSLNLKSLKFVLLFSEMIPNVVYVELMENSIIKQDLF